MISNAYRDLRLLTCTPSGLAVLFGTTLYRFPTAIKLLSYRALRDVLLSYRRWDSPIVNKEMIIILNAGNREKIAAYIKNYRAKVVVLVR